MSEYGVRTKIFLFIFLSIGINNIECMVKKLKKQIVLFDFENDSDIDNWMEISNSGKMEASSSVIPQSMPEAYFGFHMTVLEPNAHFESILNPQPNVECFCGFHIKKQFNLEGYDHIYFKGIGRGDATTYTIVLGHNGIHYPNVVFIQKFKLKIDSKTVIRLPLLKFKPQIEDKIMLDGPALNLKNITSFGIQVTSNANENNKSPCKSYLIMYKIKATTVSHEKFLKSNKKSKSKN